MINVIPTKDLREQYDKLSDQYADKTLLPKNETAGVCKGCGRRIPWGYPFIVSKWKTIRWGELKVSVPEEMWCRNGCVVPGSSQSVTRSRNQNTVEKRSRTAVTEKQDDLSAKLLAAMVEGQVYKSSEVAKAAQVEDSGFVMQSLTKLQSRGKITFTEGRWKRT